MNEIDTISAIATPSGRGGIGILRFSGPLVSVVAKEILGKLPQPRQAEYLRFCDIDGSTLDQGIALFFPGPSSFTGEDVLELHGHGGQVIMDLLLKRSLTITGIRIARPGEFSERAFINNKIDLTQVEAIADLINASSMQAARLASKSLQGVFSSRINQLVTKLTNLRMHVESDIDFPDEEIKILSNRTFIEKLNKIIISLNLVINEAHQGTLLREGIKVVIAGKPNAGKSSLLNALASRDVAIVTAIAGTTRDILCEHIQIDGMPLHIIDTAGLRHAIDEIEHIGVKRAWDEIEKADHLLFIIDSTTNSLDNSVDVTWQEDFIDRFPTSIPVTVVRTKADLTGEPVGISEIRGQLTITLSSKSGAGIKVLREHLKRITGLSNSVEGHFLARRRHLVSLETAARYLVYCHEKLIYTDSVEIAAEYLRLSHQALGEITGEFRSDDLLEEIFSNFCIGK